MRILVPYGLLIVYTMIFVFFCVDIISVGVGLIADKTIVGALAVHMHFERRMMTNSIFEYYSPHLMQAYFFIITKFGYVMVHPLMPKVFEFTKLPTMVHIRFLEREAYRNGIIASMMRYGLYYCM